VRADAVRLLCACIGVLAISTSADGAARQQTDAEDVRRLESRLVEALHARDRDGLDALLSADNVLRGAPDIERETWLRNAVALCWGDRSDVDGFRAIRHGDVVIASFDLTFYVDPGTCRPAVLRSLVTDVWVRENGEWKLKVRHAGAPPASPDDIAAQYGAVPEPPPTWEATGEFSAVATGGNTSTRTLGLNARVTHRSGRHQTAINTRFLTSQVDDITSARALMVEGRHGLDVTRRFQVFGDASHARDRFAGIDDRVAAGAGGAYTLSAPARQTFTLEGGLGWTLERRLRLATQQYATATGALHYQWTIRPGTDLRDDVTAHADLESARNWRTSNTMALTVTLTRVLSLRASHAIEYRHTPVVGFGRADMRTAIALVFSIARRPPLR
jgi:putative salt-induced outer membrane protein YdiY